MEATPRQRVLSCVQPTGAMHYGNYFGAIQNWVRLQDTYECFYGIVDYHALTTLPKPDSLRATSWEMAYNLAAVGIQPEHLFIHSLIPEHTELAWIFSCFTSFGELGRMTQFKDKSAQQQGGEMDGYVSAGLFTYPVLQAADILIYRADFVPVGEDQRQHLELTRTIAHRFNTHVGREYFILPEPLLSETPKILSPADPTRKMSKSLGEKHYISVFDDEARVRKQIMSAVTDSGVTAAANGAPETAMSAGVRNLFDLLRASGTPDDLAAHAHFTEAFANGSLRYGDLKPVVADALVRQTRIFRERRAEIMSDKKAFQTRIQDTSAAIRRRANETIREVKAMCGLTNIFKVKSEK